MRKKGLPSLKRVVPDSKLKVDAGIKSDCPSLDLVIECAELSKLVYKVNSVKSPEFASSNTSKLSPHFYAKTSVDTDVIVVSSQSLKYVAIVFRGSTTIKDWGTNINVKKVTFGSDDVSVNWKVSKQAKVHGGINDAFFVRGLPQKLEQKVNAVLRKNPDFSVLLTGHSLGGSLAVLGGMYFAKQLPNTPITSVTFGAPKICGDWCKKWVNETIGNLLLRQYVYGNDPVCSLPPYSWNYHHIGELLQLGNVQGEKNKNIESSFFTEKWNEDGISPVKDHMINVYIASLELKAKEAKAKGSKQEKTPEFSVFNRLCCGCFI